MHFSVNNLHYIYITTFMLVNGVYLRERAFKDNNYRRGGTDATVLQKKSSG